MRRKCHLLKRRLGALAWSLVSSVGQAGPLALKHDEASLTVEAYANATAGFGAADALGTGPDDARLDGALRLFGRRDFAVGPDLGARIVLRTSPEDRLEIGEASLLVLGKAGRLELGDRQGLPDVLVGYAANNFTFTGAEFGPASGPSLDPGGGLQLAFLAPELAGQLLPLTSLGFTATQAADESTKILYVSPKRRGFLAGISYAPDATDPRVRDLVQAGLTHDTYWDDNTLHVGGSYTYGNGRQEPGAASVRPLHSINAGATLVLDYDLQIGLSVTWDGSTGRVRNAEAPSPAAAFGAVGSVNYNRGPWTVGGYLQWARAEGDDAPGNDELRAGEIGFSYRTSTRLRLYGAWYYVDFSDEGGSGALAGPSGGIFLAGLRAAL